METKNKLIEVSDSNSITFQDLLDEFTLMRRLLRNDIGAYEDLSVMDRFANGFYGWVRNTETTESKAGAIGYRLASAAAPSQHQDGESPMPDAKEERGAEASEKSWLETPPPPRTKRPPLGTISASNQQRKAENRSGHEGPPSDQQDNPSHRLDKPNS